MAASLKTAAEAAEALGISPQAVGMWARRPGAPVAKKGKKQMLRWPAFPRWRDAEREKQIREEERSKDDHKTSGLTRKLEAEAKLKELELDERIGNLIPAETFDAEVNAIAGGFAAAAARLQRFEREIVRAATPGDARRITQAIERALMEGIQELADHLDKSAEEAE